MRTLRYYGTPKVLQYSQELWNSGTRGSQMKKILIKIIEYQHGLGTFEVPTDLDSVHLVLEPRVLEPYLGTPNCNSGTELHQSTLSFYALSTFCARTAG